MAVKYSDEEISAFLNEKKTISSDFRKRTKLKDKRGHREQELDITSAKGNHFRIILRQSNFNPLDFSIILALCSTDTTQLFRLRRYNGKSHEHTNPIENNTFYDFHIHKATERYQEFGMREDTFAESNKQFTDFLSTLKLLFYECGFEIPRKPQQNIFGD